MIALPAALVRALRDPAPTEAEFTPTQFTPATTKAWFAVHMFRFCSSDFPQHQFTHRFYAQLMHCYGMIAHYDRAGFWAEFFTSTAGKVEFLDQVTAWPSYGSPDHTWCDVERVVIRRLRAADLLGLYRQRLHAEHDVAERAEFARLRAKYEGDAAAVDPGVLRTVLVPAGTRSGGPRTSRRSETSQLALGLG